jgi:uncharacterized lipoprotein YajG
MQRIRQIVILLIGAFLIAACGQAPASQHLAPQWPPVPQRSLQQRHQWHSQLPLRQLLLW